MEPLIQTDRTDLYVQNLHLIDLLMAYYRENSEFLLPWEPKREESYFSFESFSRRLETAGKSFEEGSSVQLAAVDRESGRTAGVANFSGIVRGPFQACFLGYSLARDFEGKGYMTEILRAAIDYMFREKKLHRIMANYLPRNERSGRLLERLGFEKEGLAKEYLQINGKWEDHILTSLINRDHRFE